MVHGEVVGLKNGELVLGGILEGDYKDRMADRLLRLWSYDTVSPYSHVSKMTHFASNRLWNFNITQPDKKHINQPVLTKRAARGWQNLANNLERITFCFLLPRSPISLFTAIFPGESRSAGTPLFSSFILFWKRTPQDWWPMLSENQKHWARSTYLNQGGSLTNLILSSHNIGLPTEGALSPLRQLTMKFVFNESFPAE